MKISTLGRKNTEQSKQQENVKALLSTNDIRLDISNFTNRNKWKSWNGCWWKKKKKRWSGFKVQENWQEVLFFKKYMQEKLFKATLKTQVFCILLTNTYVVCLFACLDICWTSPVVNYGSLVPWSNWKQQADKKPWSWLLLLCGFIVRP